MKLYRMIWAILLFPRHWLLMVMYKEAMKRDAAYKEVNCSKRWPLEARQDSSKYSQVKNRYLVEYRKEKLIDLSATNEAELSKI